MRFATGYRYALPPCLAPITQQLACREAGRPVVTADFSPRWKAPAKQRIDLQNAGRLSHSIADLPLSLAAWRSAVVVNSLMGWRHSNDYDAPHAVSWPRRSGTVQNTARAA
ncbi:hypothetical protein [Gulbenkiania mobilis]|uniref:hypothetical protein n=1 Tax=Gulbenkiania mobilis TaxID=397457 RepID=UPI0006BBE44D|nr:hypothetical protein [Gulbenkiania mobilis]